jgi:molybdopterin-biosynthesis enzyme MoeA-like protein
MNFYAVIIGTEILNGRREDKHFEFVKNELKKYGHELLASFIIKDDKELMMRTYKMIIEDKKSVIFSFGGIGSTPDDLTREIVAKVFTNTQTQRHEQFYKDIVERFAEKAFPHRVKMADLPPGAALLFNPVNNMSGFSLEDRFFFVPGFPSMSHPMISDVIKTYFFQSIQKYRKTLLAHTSEESLISLMQELPNEIELSCLPMFVQNKPHVELSLQSSDETLLLAQFQLFTDELTSKGIYYKLI